MPECGMNFELARPDGQRYLFCKLTGKECSCGWYNQLRAEQAAARTRGVDETAFEIELRR